MEGLEQLVEMSNRYGADAEYVLAGGGNTSYKNTNILYVKASGTRLADITEAGFVRMDRPALLSMLNKGYPAGDAEREAEALTDMMAAVLPGQPGMRPSVECLLHAMFPQSYVLHLHPALVNGLTCGQKGAEMCAALLGDEAVWLPLTKPGYVLAKASYDAFEAYRARTGKEPALLLMQNHGIIAAGNSVAEIDALMQKVMRALAAQVNAPVDESPLAAPAAAEAIAPVLRALYARQEGNGFAAYHNDALMARFDASPESLQPLALPFTPDQIVYCKASPLYLANGADTKAAFEEYIAKHGYSPKIVVAQGVGLFAMGKSRKEADIARQVFLDSAKVAVYAESFGGPLQLTKDFTDFILNWEVENYRQKVSLAAGAQDRMKGKVCIVTGAAQGFGEGIARGLAAQGGSVVVADMNEAGAQAVAAKLEAEYGIGCAMGVAVNVADEASVANMIRQTVLYYGGLDVMVSCAGILTAGSLADLTKEAFDRVTSVNYTGYFLCAKYSTVPMKLQHAANPAHIGDIIEINSKSGLEGSKANFAYAGSKFGGIGLTQSFALELAEYNIKVNAICPGNLLDGPLWSDPERGLFKQYLDAGKVPGAKTVQDVRAFYEGKVPLGRGCTVEDVAKAVTYVIEQEYETGQALPVTGGQVMLH